MKVKYYYSNQIIDGTLVYRRSENSFDFLSNNTGDISILIKYLQITINASNNRMISVWGLHPHHLWKKTNLVTPTFKDGIVECIGNYESGVSYRIEEYENWDTYFDQSNGWFCIGNYNLEGEAIMFANNIGMIISENRVVSIWLRPQII